MIEVERKFRLSPDNWSRVKTSLYVICASPTFARQIDRVFLRDATSFEDFRPGDPVIRLRMNGHYSKMTYKRSINDAGDTLELETSIGSVFTLAEIIKELGFSQVAEVKKNRFTFRNGKLSFMLDGVDYLGYFLEIETLIDDREKLAEAEQLIMSAAAELGLSADDIETQKYDQLIGSVS